MDVQLILLGFGIAAAPDPARVIDVQIAALKLKQPNLHPGFFAVHGFSHSHFC